LYKFLAFINSLLGTNKPLTFEFTKAQLPGDIPQLPIGQMKQFQK